MTARPDAGGAARVLIVDDSPSKLRALESLLEPLGVETVCAGSGRAALRYLLQQTPAVIMLDVRMPEMDGFETAELIRRRPSLERTPILFVTAFDQAEADMARGFALGAVDFVLSPIVPEILRNKVSVLIDLYQATEKVRRQSEALLRLETERHRTRLARAENRRRRAEQRFATILALAGDAILAVDEAHRVVIFNRAAESIFGRDARRTLGRPVDELIVDGVAHLGAPRGGAAAASREVECRRADGALFPGEVTVSDTEDGHQRLRTIILRDITERRENEIRLRRLHEALDERLVIGIDLVAALAETLDAELVLDRLLVQAAAAVRAGRGTLVRLDADTGMVTDTRELNHTAGFDRAVLPETQPMLREALETRRPVISAAFTVDHLPAAASAWGGAPRHVAVVPLAAGETVLALLLLCREEGDAFSAGDVDTLELIANVAVVALRNADLYARAESSSRSKSDFLNLAAHELRTPVTVIRGYTAMLSDGSLGPIPPAWERPLLTVAAKAEELNSLVDDLLTAARLEARQFTAVLRQVDLRSVVSEAAQRHRPQADLLGGTLGIQLPREPVMVSADPALTARILDNLVANALSYSLGPPHVRLIVDAGERAVRVVDRGPGISEDLRGRIFERFVRGDHALIGPRPGTGLGLYIGRSLAGHQGADLILEDTGPEGSIFTIAFPLPEEAEEVAIEGAARGFDAELAAAP